jgi:hypothetical protein
MRISLCIAIILFLLGCKKAEDRACFKSAGSHGVKEIELGTFNRMELGPRMRFILIQDTVEKIVLSGGENLLNSIETEIVDGVLTVKNANKCNFLRKLTHEVLVQIHLKNVYHIIFEGTKELTCKNQLVLPYLTFVIRDGAGKCNLNVNCDALTTVVTYGWGNFELSGQTNYLKLDIRSNGFGSAYDLQVQDSLNIISSSSELVKINGDGAAVRAELSSYGDIWYVGSPNTLEYNKYGEGELINKN